MAPESPRFNPREASSGITSCGPDEITFNRGAGVCRAWQEAGFDREATTGSFHVSAVEVIVWLLINETCS